ncbi:MAG: DUF349 domain-containing protein [Moraxellaceae bacterium]|nr:DUF349 domain-containing protein [Moraxellaceae bacterium]
MLSKLFRSTPKWQSIKSQKRIEAIRELLPEQEKDLEILTQLAKEDSEPAVRREAVQKLHDLDILMQIQKRDLEAVVREAAAERIHELMAGKSPFSPPLEERLQRLERINSSNVLLALIRDAEPVEVRLAAIAALQDDMCLQDIALHSSIARLRQAAAERITTLPLLEELMQASKLKDKTVYRIVKGRLDEIRDKEKAETERQERAVTLCELMEAHARSALNPLYAAKTESLRMQWNELTANHSFSVAERFATAHALACRQVADIVAAEQLAADQTQAREELSRALETLESTVKEYRGQDDFDVSSLAAVRKTQRLRWELACELHSPAANLVQRYESAMQKLDSLEALLAQWSIDKLMIETTLKTTEPAVADSTDEADGGAEGAGATNAINAAVRDEMLTQMIKHYRETGWPLPELLQQAVGTVKEKPLVIHEPKEDHQKALQKQLDRVESCIREGNSREASRRWRQVADFARTHHLNHPLLPLLGEKVRELKSWAGFVIQPKKEALLTSMQALVDQDIDPDDKADRIKALQDEWKSLGVADPAIEQPLWEQFKTASDAAFEPCRRHFAVQNELRAKNRERKIALCEQLEQYRDAMTENIDWKNHEAILKAARQEWQQHQPVDRQSLRQVQSRFNDVIKALESRRDEHWSRLAQGKQALIDKARLLLVQEDMRSACDQAKQLQQEWKQIGGGSPRTDGKQWKEFRAACDAVFSRREDAFKVRQEAREGLMQQAETLVASMEQLIGDASDAGRQEMSRLHDAFRELDIGRDGQALKERAQKAVTLFDSTFHEHRRQQASRLLKAGVDAWVAVCSAEQALIDNALPLQPDVSGLPSVWKSALLRRQQAADAITIDTEKRTIWQEGIESNTQTVLDALMDLELALNLPSQASREKDRRERQLALLQQKGLRAGASGTNELDLQRNLQLVLETGPISPLLVEEMVPRLLAITLKMQ